MTFFNVGTQRASRSINEKLVDSVLGSTLRSVGFVCSLIEFQTKIPPCSRWLDGTPTSRIITRCTQDIVTVDGDLAKKMASLAELVVSMAIKLGSSVIFTPVFLLPGVLIATLGVYIGNIYMRAQMPVKREMRQVQLFLNKVGT